MTPGQCGLCVFFILVLMWQVLQCGWCDDTLYSKGWLLMGITKNEMVIKKDSKLEKKQIAFTIR